MTQSEQLAVTPVAGVDIAHWNPRRRVRQWGSPTRFARPVNNFGDLLGPLIVRALVREFGLTAPPADAERRRLVVIGSVVHLAEPGDVVWGAGLTTKPGTERDHLPQLDIRAVRGPGTSALLAERYARPVPEVFGDPGLLLGTLMPQLAVAPAKRSGTSIVPNLNALATLDNRDDVVNPRWPLRRVLARIAASELVVGSSLHGIIVAESLGVPARGVRTPAEGAFKYEDYYRATGRDPDSVLAGTVAEAVARGGAEPPEWDPRPLLSAFPTDLWSRTARDDTFGSRLGDSRVMQRESSIKGEK